MADEPVVIQAYHSDPTAVVVDVYLSAEVPAERMAQFRQDALAVKEHWSSFGPVSGGTHGPQFTFTLGESHGHRDLFELREWLAGQGDVRQVIIEIGRNWRPAGP